MNKRKTMVLAIAMTTVTAGGLVTPAIIYIDKNKQFDVIAETDIKNEEGEVSRQSWQYRVKKDTLISSLSPVDVELPGVDLSGWEFIGWYKDEKCTEKYSDTDTVTQDMVIYAKFQAIRYDVTFTKPDEFAQGDFISLVGADGSRISDAVDYDGEVRFRLAATNPKYDLSNVKVLVNGVEVEANENGFYVISNVKDDIHVTFENVAVKTFATSVKLGSNQVLSDFSVSPSTGYDMNSVEYGKDFKFSVALDDKFSDSQVVVRANEVPLIAQNGVYTISNVTENQEIEVITLTDVSTDKSGYTWTSKSANAVYDDKFEIKLTVGERYSRSTPQIQIAGRSFTRAISSGEQGRDYTFKIDREYINGNVEFRVTDVIYNLYQLSLPTDRVGYTLTGAIFNEGEQVDTAQFTAVTTENINEGSKFAFRIDLSEGYTKSSPVVTVNGQTLTATNGIYVIENVLEAKNIEISGVELNTYSLTITNSDFMTVKDGDNNVLSNGTIAHGTEFTVALTNHEWYSQNVDVTGATKDGVVYTAKGDVTITYSETEQIRNTYILQVGQNDPLVCTTQDNLDLDALVEHFANQLNTGEIKSWTEPTVTQNSTGKETIYTYTAIPYTMMALTYYDTDRTTELYSSDEVKKELFQANYDLAGFYNGESIGNDYWFSDYMYGDEVNVYRISANNYVRAYVDNDTIVAFDTVSASSFNGLDLLDVDINNEVTLWRYSSSLNTDSNSKVKFYTNVDNTPATINIVNNSNLEEHDLVIYSVQFGSDSQWQRGNEINANNLKVGDYFCLSYYTNQGAAEYNANRLYEGEYAYWYDLGVAGLKLEGTAEYGDSSTEILTYLYRVVGNDQNVATITIKNGDRVPGTMQVYQDVNVTLQLLDQNGDEILTHTITVDEETYDSGNYVNNIQEYINGYDTTQIENFDHWECLSDEGTGVTYQAVLHLPYRIYYDSEDIGVELFDDDTHHERNAIASGNYIPAKYWSLLEDGLVDSTSTFVNVYVVVDQHEWAQTHRILVNNVEQEFSVDDNRCYIYVENITEDLHITVEEVEQPQVEMFTVTFDPSIIVMAIETYEYGIPTEVTEGEWQIPVGAVVMFHPIDDSITEGVMNGTYRILINGQDVGYLSGDSYEITGNVTVTLEEVQQDPQDPHEDPQEDPANAREISFDDSMFNVYYATNAAGVIDYSRDNISNDGTVYVGHYIAIYRADGSTSEWRDTKRVYLNNELLEYHEGEECWTAYLTGDANFVITCEDVQNQTYTVTLKDANGNTLDSGNVTVTGSNQITLEQLNEIYDYTNIENFDHWERVSGSGTSYTYQAVVAEETLLAYTVDSTNNTATITGIGEDSGDVHIPQCILHEGEHYTVTAIATAAFQDCKKLTGIYIPRSVTSIGGDAFSNCDNINSITVERGNTYYHSINNCLINTTGRNLIAGSNTTTSIPNVRNITAGAFSGRTSLNITEIPEGVSNIGAYAFRGCTSLTSISLPSTLNDIWVYAFVNCPNLETITVAQGNTKYHSDGNCVIETAINKLILGCKTSVIPNDGSVTKIDGNAFRGCTGLEEIVIPGSITEIGSFAFYGCTGLEEIVIPGSITEIGSYAFKNCDNLTKVYYQGTKDDWTNVQGSSWAFGSNVTIYYIYHVSLIDEKGDDLTNGNVTVTGSNQITLEQLNEIYDYTNIENFDHWECLSDEGTGVTYQAVLHLDYKVYYESEDIGVELFDDDGHHERNAIESGNYIPAKYWSLLEDGLVDSTSTCINIYFKGASSGDEEFHTWIATHRIIVNGDVYGIDEDNRCYIYLEDITEDLHITVEEIEEAEGHAITFDNSVMSIGWSEVGDQWTWDHTIDNSGDTTTASVVFVKLKDEIFANVNDYVLLVNGEPVEIDSDNRTTISISGDTTIELAVAETAFAYTVDTTNHTATITGLGSYEYQDIGAGNEFYIPSKIKHGGVIYTVTGIGKRAFYQNTNIEKLYLPTTVVSIGEESFSQCSNLSYLGNNNLSYVQTIGEKAFHFCSGITEVDLSSIITSYIDSSGETKLGLGRFAFTECTGLAQVSSLGSITTIPQSAFYHTAITSIDLTGITTIDEAAFRYCSHLVTLTGTSDIESIGENAFRDCTSLEGELALPNLTSMVKFAFANCPRLTKVSFGNLATMPQSAFYQCSGLLSADLRGVTYFTTNAFRSCTSLEYVILDADLTKLESQIFLSDTNLTAIYYEGDEDSWTNVIKGTNAIPSTTTIYFYSETEPSEEGNYWHYVDNEVTEWG